MSDNPIIWEVDEGKIKKLLIEYDGGEKVIPVKEIDATLDNIRLLLDQDPLLFDILPVGSSDITTANTEIDTQSEVPAGATDTSPEDDYNPNLRFLKIIRRIYRK